ncbi:hypothetical protein CHS0354_019464 [Potamilus streckersoni]|uniref:NTR domain-containing protein n=1 Tax=Potamilus streckersoni TaxID=2493646 RepID=A0AAE0SGX3_9BIVA|nr:hypothetical protein CHS0354_019464 [Potamilus streckersoni]
MERSSMFLHSLLVLLVVIQVTFACNCRPISLGQAICNSNTVILARVLLGQPFDDGVSSVERLRYPIQIQQKFQEESTPISLNDGIGYITFPQTVSDCGGLLHNGKDYVIAGNVDVNGVLVTSTCKHIVEYQLIVEDSHYTDILQNGVDCKNV